MKRSFKISLLKRKQKRLTPRLRRKWSVYSSDLSYLPVKKHQRLRSIFRQKLSSLKKFKFLFGFFKTSQVNKFVTKIKKKKWSLFRRALVSKLFLKLDIFLIRLGFIKTIYESKQFIRNGFVYVNGQVVKSSFFMLKKGDVVMIHPLKKKEILDGLCSRAKSVLTQRWKRKKKFRRFGRRLKTCVQFRNFSQFEINYKLLTAVVMKETLSNSDAVLSFPYKLSVDHLSFR